MTYDDGAEVVVADVGVRRFGRRQLDPDVLGLDDHEEPDDDATAGDQNAGHDERQAPVVADVVTWIILCEFNLRAPRTLSKLSETIFCKSFKY